MTLRVKHFPRGVPHDAVRRSVLISNHPISRAVVWRSPSPAGFPEGAHLTGLLGSRGCGALARAVSRRRIESQTDLPFARQPDKGRTSEVRRGNCAARFRPGMVTTMPTRRQTDVEKCGIWGGEPAKRDIFTGLGAWADSAGNCAEHQRAIGDAFTQAQTSGSTGGINVSREQGSGAAVR